MDKRTPKSNKGKAWEELFELLRQVHKRNRGYTEEEVTRDVVKAVTELREEDYAKRRSRCDDKH